MYDVKYIIYIVYIQIKKVGDEMNTTDRVPLYQTIQDYIRDLIESEVLKKGDRIPTEKELMERYNVSKITVVNALTGLGKEKIIDRVPGKGSFVSDPQPKPAKAPQAGKGTGRIVKNSLQTRIIGLIIPSLDEYFAMQLVKGAHKALAKKSYRTMILLSGGILEMEREAIKTLKEIGVEGLLVCPVDEEQYNEEIIEMKLSGFPIVLIDHYLPGVETDYIATDGRMGVTLAVDHLWELGHREIAICSDSPSQTVQERIESYMNALKNKGALINPNHIVRSLRVESYNGTDNPSLFRYIHNRMATAYITLNGRLGVQIYQIASQIGLHIPGDLSIVSFDDPTGIVEEFSMFTHIKQFKNDIGYHAAGRVLELIQQGEDRRGGEYSKKLIQPELIVCRTTGPVRLD